MLKSLTLLINKGMIEINKFPVIILSSPRTGSNLLSNIIANTYPKSTLFLEPDEKKSIDNFSNYANSSNQYILKCHLKYLPKYPNNIIKKVINNDAFLIRIRRRNVLDQMVSMYIELIRHIWYYDVETAEKYKENIIPIEADIIAKAVRQIKEFNEPFKGFNINYDLDIYYEDLINNINDNYNTIISPKPINHNEIYEAIERYLINSK